MVIAKVVSKKSLQMAFVESDDVIEQIAAAASHPALGNPVLPGTLDRSLHVSNLQSANGSGNIQSILLIVVEEKEAGRGLVGKCFAQLLDDPTAGWMRLGLSRFNVLTNEYTAFVEFAGEESRTSVMRGGRPQLARILNPKPRV